MLAPSSAIQTSLPIAPKGALGAADTMMASAMSIARITRMETTATTIPPIPARIGSGDELKIRSALGGLPPRSPIYNIIASRTTIEAFPNTATPIYTSSTSADTFLIDVGLYIRFAINPISSKSFPSSGLIAINVPLLRSPMSEIVGLRVGVDRSDNRMAIRIGNNRKPIDQIVSMPTIPCIPPRLILVVNRWSLLPMSRKAVDRAFELTNLGFGKCKDPMR